jgi:hypothetical protein|tara:strand:- start:10500 stop:10631 length:132 start_codon:yes stop_codon:yes gene_type:complete
MVKSDLMVVHIIQFQLVVKKLKEIITAGTLVEISLPRGFMIPL